MPQSAAPLAPETVVVRCPGCQQPMAHLEGDGRPYIVERGKRFRFTGEARLSEFYCDKCKKWFTVPSRAGSLATV